MDFVRFRLYARESEREPIQAKSLKRERAPLAENNKSKSLRDKHHMQLMTRIRSYSSEYSKQCVCEFVWFRFVAASDLWHFLFVWARTRAHTWPLWMCHTPKPPSLPYPFLSYLSPSLLSIFEKSNHSVAFPFYRINESPSGLVRWTLVFFGVLSLPIIYV